jgi:lysophospholipase L1-like esterase
MNKKDMLKRSLLFNLLVSWCLVSGQDTIRFTIPNDLGLVDQTKNVIVNPKHLDWFFEKLYQLKSSQSGSVNIVHIGDSHIQADYLTHQARKNFQKEFGNAGRGFVVPGRVAQTNEPNNYITQSDHKWESKRMVFPDQPLPIGLGGITIRSEQENASLNLMVRSYPELNYYFNKVTVFFLKEPRSYNIVIQDSLKLDLAFIGSFSSSTINHSASIALPYLTNHISFKAFKSLPQQDRVTLFGFNLENGKSGVLYHGIGSNGAKYKHYLAAEHLAEQSKALHPDLIIIALGTNEVLDHPYSDPKFTEYVDGVVQHLKTQNPKANLLISIHPDSYKKKTKRNPAVIAIRKKLIEYAEEKGLPYFDLYEASGGHHSADQWKEAGLLRDDGVHFTRQGYELQGNMFYNALMKAYNNYVSNRLK